MAKEEEKIGLESIHHRLIASVMPKDTKARGLLSFVFHTSNKNQPTNTIQVPLENIDEIDKALVQLKELRKKMEKHNKWAAEQPK